MSLATRCTACGTIFRVVQDQLKVSEGWVRCGRCSEVFNALDGLFDLGQLPQRQTSAAAAASVAPDPRLQPGAGEFVASRSPPPTEAAPPVAARTAAETESGGDEFFFSVNPEPDARPFFEAAAAADVDVRRGDHDDFVDARFPSEFPPGAADESADLRAPREPHFEPPHDEGAPTIHAADELTPAFVREADRAARWARPGVRAALGAGVLLLLATLGLQVSLHFRDAIAVTWPPSQPLLAALCEPLGCRVEPLRRIHALVVDGSALNRSADGSGYRLEVLLRNRDAVPVALPAIDLQLSDASGAVLARRVLSADQFRVADAVSVVPVVLDAGRELPLQINFSASGVRVAGYSIELFYP